MAGSLTDAQLRISLKELGYDAGPITESTRSVYEKKLMKLMDQPKASSTASQKKRKGKTQQNEIPDSISKRSEPQELAAKGMNVVPDRVASSSENSRSGSSSYIARRASIGRSGDATLTNDWSPATSSMITPSVLADSKNRLAHSVVSRTLSRPEEHISTKLTATTESCFSRVNTPQRAAGHTPTRKTYIYYSNGGNGQSESDTDEEPPSRTSLSGTISRVAGWLRKEAQPNDSGLSVSSRRTGRYSFDRELHEDGQIQVSDTDHSDIESRHRSPFFSGLRNPPNSVLARDAGTVTSKSLLFTPPRSASRVLASPKRFGQSFLSDDSDDHGFHDDRSDPSVGVILRNNRISRTWTRYLSSSVSHIPNLILVCSIVLLFVLVMSYLILKDHHGEVGKMADLQKLICPSSLPAGAIDPIASHKCLPQSDINEALPVLSTTFDVLSRYAGEYHCKQNQLLSPRLSIISAAGLVKLNTESAGTVRKEFPVVWKHVLYLILHFGKAHFSIACYDASGREIGPNSDPIEVSELESLQPYFSGTCRLKRLVSWLIRLCVTILGVLVALGSFIGVVLLLRWVRTNRIQAAEKRLARIRDLVADIVHMLQQQIRENEANPEQPLHIPVYVLRERLRQQHPDVVELWPEVVRYIYDVETCIGVQEWRGIGETWQWQGGTGWQGSALSDKSQRTPFITPPTECLKIRNMFSTDGLDERGKLRVKRELLKRLGSCGPILHIGLDSVGTKGLVYIKCSSSETAGRVYQAVHANYFDGRLLTVKFLRDAKYCLRFPEAHGLTRPICLSDLE